MPKLNALNSHTPILGVIDPRGCAVRSVAYLRVSADDPVESRVARQAWNAPGRSVAQWDPRLWASSAAPNDRRVHALDGTVLRSDHVDAGRRWIVPGPDGVVRWRGQASGDVDRTEVDPSGRPWTFFERRPGEAERCVERRIYGGPGDVAGRAAGRLRVHDDGAGRVDGLAYDLAGTTTRQRRRFLAEPDGADWPASEASLGSDGYETHDTTNPLGQVLVRQDARGHARRFAHDLAGGVVRVVLQPARGEAQVVSDAIDYDAQGHVSREVLGNGVTTLADYDPAHGRLVRLRRSRPDRVLQDLGYAYDPVGNVIETRDDALPTEWFAGEQVDPVNRYRYDALSQLVEASGRESSTSGFGPALPDVALPGDGHRLRKYRESYDYDAAGNLLSRRHVATGGSFTQGMSVDATSNRAVLDDGGAVDIAAAFDAAGQQRFLQRGQPMGWDGQGRLSRVVTVSRPDGRDDDERYVYAADGERVWKRRRWWVDGSQHVEDIRYLPGLQLRGDVDIVSVDAGRSTCRLVRSPSGEQVRYELDDRLHSVCLELDERGRIVSYEGYLPYGGTAWRAGLRLVEAGERSRRHAGRERDATGLYHYGHRFYAPWLCRWMSPDPAGDVDGPNRYRFARGNPTSLRDVAGLYVDDADYDSVEELFAQFYGAHHMSRGLHAADGAASPADRTTVAEGLRLASDLTRRAATNLTNNAFPEIDLTLSIVFGFDRRVPDDVASLSVIRTDMAQAMHLLHDQLQPRTVQGNDGLVWFDSPHETSAVTNPLDPSQRIFIHRDTVRSYDRTHVAAMLVHEQSHLTLETRDIHYSIDDAMTDTPFRQRDVSSVISRYVPSLKSLGGYEPPSASRHDAISDQEQAIVDEVPGGATTYEQMSGSDRQRLMLLRNADTYATLAATAGADMVAFWDRTRARLPRAPRAS